MLSEEIIEALNILESCGVSEDKRREILIDGVSFNFSYGERDYQKRDRHYNIFEFTSRIKSCLDMGIGINVNAIINNPEEYEEFITVTDGVQVLKKKFSKNAQN